MCLLVIDVMSGKIERILPLSDKLEAKILPDSLVIHSDSISLMVIYLI